MTKCVINISSVEWEEDWSDNFPSDNNEIRRKWIEYGFDHDGEKYTKNRWHDSWHSGHDSENSAWKKKQILDNDWNGKHDWFWGNGGSRGWGVWSNKKHYGDIDNEPENGYISWGSINTDNWKNNGGGEGWSKWEVNDHGPGNGGHEYGEWKGWKVGLGSGKWDSWNSGNKPK